MGWIKKNANSKIGQIFQYSMIKYIALGFGMIKSMVNAKFLGPELLGVLGNLTLMLGYCSYANLGILNSMNREYMLYKGKDDNKAREVINTTFTFLCGISIIFIGLGVFSLAINDGMFGIYLMLIFTIAICEQFRLFFINYYRLTDNYRFINIIEVIYSICIFILTILLIEELQILGVLISMLICGVIIMIIGITQIKIFKLRFNKEILKDLIVIGIPLLIYNLGFYILSTIDRLIIIRYLTEADLGYYTFANSMVSATLVFISSLLFLLYPKVIKAFNEGESNNIISKVTAYTKVLELSSVIFFIVGIIAFEPFIKIILPKYENSIGVYIVLLMAVIINNIAYFSNVYIVSNKKQKYLVYLQILAIGINFSFNFVFVKMGFGIKGIALGTLIANITYSIVQHSIFIKLNTKKTDIKYVMKIYSKIVIFVACQTIVVFLNIGYLGNIIIMTTVAVVLYIKEWLNFKEYLIMIKEK